MIKNSLTYIFTIFLAGFTVYLLADKILLPYIFYVDEGDGFPLFLIHGLAGDHKAWLEQIEYFKSNYRIIAVDNPGSGKSSSVSQPCTTRDLANTMIEVMQILSLIKHTLWVVH